MKAVAMLTLWTFTAQQATDPVLESVRSRLLQDMKKMKRYTCRQTVRRLEVGKRKPGPRNCPDTIAAHAAHPTNTPLIAWDRLRLDVGLVNGQEIFSWAGAPTFEADVRKIAGYGVFGTGDFGPFLNSVFGSGSIIQFEGERTLGGRKLREYRYQVPLKASGYAVRVFSRSPVTVAHNGYFLLDPKSNDIDRLVVQSAELPETLENCQAISDIKYTRVLIGQVNTLLPRESTFRVIKEDGTEDLNTTTYSGCREYIGESVVHFDGEEPPAEKVVAPEHRVPIPDGLQFRVRITTQIDSDTGAGGDEIEGVLTSDMADRAGLIFAPAGSRVRGRLTQLSGSAYQVQIMMRLESIDLNGMVPIHSEYRARFPERHVRLKNYQAVWVTEKQ